MKQQKWEWLLALKRPVIWLIPLVITTLFILPMLRGRMVARGTTAAVLRDDASTVMESRDLATIRRVIKAGPKAQPTVMTYQQAKKLLPLAKKVTAAVNAGDRVAYPKAVTAFFAATDMRAPKYEYLAAHHVPFYDFVDTQTPFTNYLLNQVMYFGNTTYVVLALAVLVAFLTTMGRGKRDEFAALLPMRANQVLLNQQVVIGLTTFGMVLLALILMAVPVIVRGGMGSWQTAFFSGSGVDFKADTRAIIVPVLKALAFYLLGLLAVSLMLTGLALLLKQWHANLITTALALAAVVMLPSRAVLQWLPSLAGVLQVLPGSHTDISMMLMMSQETYPAGPFGGQGLLGLTVLFAWAAVFLIAGHVVVHRRQAA
ncbi:hypothetical protein [Lacticaseibacillus hegangensis]|uniref:ABC transporter permease n=1 Tax=Lacticaseibacillus hegangensis TaxID=2486010 RepID=A0ABW4CUR7_9LACO|nr:hypothetical protein [Lacticaseibacillus hegangensis]